MRRRARERQRARGRLVTWALVGYLAVVAFGVFGPSPGEQIQQAGDGVRQAADEIAVPVPGRSPGDGRGREPEVPVLGRLTDEAVANVAMFVPLGVWHSLRDVKTVILEMPEEWLEERHRLDLDRKDEMWEGVLHVVPPASSSHNEVGADLLGVFHRYAAARGLRRFVGPGVFGPAVPGMTSYRVADVGFARPEHVARPEASRAGPRCSSRSSPRRTSRTRSCPSTAASGSRSCCTSMRPPRAFEVRRPDADGWLVAGADHQGWVGLASLGLGLRTVKARLQVRTPNGIEEL